MNSSQRRNWRREKAEETDELIRWINSPDRYIASGEKSSSSDGIIEMTRERHYKAAFGKPSDHKAGWKTYLIRMGVDPSKFSPEVVFEETIVVTEKIHL